MATPPARLVPFHPAGGSPANLKAQIDYDFGASVFRSVVGRRDLGNKKRKLIMAGIAGRPDFCRTLIPS